MKRFISFGSIEQFRNIVVDVTHAAHYVGQNENNEPIYDKTRKKPTLVFTLSEKIHGTNAGVSFYEDGSDDGVFWVQSRNNIITPESDNAGCAFQATVKKEIWKRLIKNIAYEHDVDLTKNIITLFFEWCGGNIQKKSAVTGLDKRAIVFQHCKISPIIPNELEKSIWIETRFRFYKKPDCEFQWASSNDDGIWNIMDFPTYKISIDFENTHIANNELIELVTKTIEPNSPVGKSFGIENNVGEGVVCTCMFNGGLLRFKVKGEEHSNSKVKTLKPVDENKENKKREFANYACKSWRLEQAWQTVFGIENEKKVPSTESTGDFLKAVINDVMKEELDIMANYGLEPKEVNGYISKIAREWFITELNNLAGIK